MDLLIRTMTDKRQTRPLVREDAPIKQDSNFHIGGGNLVVGPRRVLDTKTYWLTDRQSQYDFDFDFDFDSGSSSSVRERERERERE
jgi:hypothetical protein